MVRYIQLTDILLLFGKQSGYVRMKVAITASDTFVAPYIVEMLGDAVVIIPDEAIKDQLTIDALLTPCSCLLYTSDAADE